MTVSDSNAKLSPITDTLRAFFRGRVYPAAVALLTLVGHISGLEFYLNIPNMLAVSLALFVSDSFIVALPFMLTVVFQATLKHSPGVPTWSDYYYTVGKLVTFSILVAILAASLIFFIVKRVIPRVKSRGVSNIPLFPGTVLLCSAFLLNGIFGEWTVSGVIYGAAQCAVYFILFYTLYYGLLGEDSDELIERCIYLAVLVAAVIIGEMIFMLTTYDGLFENGSLVKESINLGWGIWNPIGFSLTVLIPMLMYGAMRSRYPWICLTAAISAWAFAVLTLSRNALLFSSLALAASIIIACFKGKRQREFRIITVIGAVLAAIGGVIVWDKISSLLLDLFNRGLSDNGRIELWRIGLRNFLDAPIFGKGFFSYGETEVFRVASFIPTLAHSTPIELLSATGVFGLAAYLFYRVLTVIPFIKRPSFDKLMLSLPPIITVGMSLIDNYTFHFYTVFWYLICLAIAIKLDREA